MIAVMRIAPMQGGRDLLSIHFEELGAYVNHRKLALAVRGGYEVRWRFDCKQQESVMAGASWDPGFRID